MKKMPGDIILLHMCTMNQEHMCGSSNTRCDEHNFRPFLRPFPTGFTVRSVETGLGRWKMVVAMISVDAYPFFWLSET